MADLIVAKMKTSIVKVICYFDYCLLLIYCSLLFVFIEGGVGRRRNKDTRANSNRKKRNCAGGGSSDEEVNGNAGSALTATASGQNTKKKKSKVTYEIISIFIKDMEVNFC